MSEVDGPLRCVGGFWESLHKGQGHFSGEVSPVGNSAVEHWGSRWVVEWLLNVGNITRFHMLGAELTIQGYEANAQVQYILLLLFQIF